MSGLIVTPSGTLKISPLKEFDARAPPGVGVVFESDDIVRPENLRIDHVIEPIQVDNGTGVDAHPRSKFMAGGMQLTAVSDIDFLALAEHDFYSHFGDPGYIDQIDQVMGEVNTIFYGSVGFVFQIQGYEACTTSTCNANRGWDTSAAGDLALKSAQYCDDVSGIENCQMWADRDLHHGQDYAVLGAAHEPGRAGVSQTEPQNEYDGRYYWENSEIVAHELGHNFCGRHSEADAHISGSGTWYTLMWSPWYHEQMNHWFSNDPTNNADNEQNIAYGNMNYGQMKWSGGPTSACDWG